MKMSSIEENCSICLGKVVNGINLCSDKSHENLCYTCISSYIESTISSCVYGTCPSITCPSLAHKKRSERKLLSEEVWSMMVPTQILDKYHDLASSLLMLCCVTCHGIASLDVKYSSDSSKLLQEIIVSNSSSNDPTSQDAWHSFQVDSQLYSSGGFDADSYYTCILSQYLPKLKTCSDEKAWGMFIPVLRSVYDAVQRINLHLRYLRDRPEIKTICCNTAHCFRCVTIAHGGKTCIENQIPVDVSWNLNHDNFIIHCAKCNISLVKGDGCDSVTCVCGHNFDWSVEKDARALVDVFMETYPVNTHKHCARVLCSDNTPTTERQTAEAWRSINTIAVNMEMSLWFKHKYSQCVAQVCMLIWDQLLIVNDYETEAAILCGNDYRYKNEMNKCRQELRASRISLFVTMYPREEDRILVSNLASNNTPYFMSNCAEIRESIRLWQYFVYGEQKIKKQIINFDLVHAKQFIYFYGTRSIQNTLVEIMSCPSRDSRRKMYGGYLSEMNKISARISESFSLYDNSCVSELRCDGNIWVSMNNNDVDLAAERYHSMEDAIWYVMNINYANTVQDITTQTSYDLTTLNALTWNDLIAVLSWCRDRHDSEVGQGDEYFGSFFC